MNPEKSDMRLTEFERKVLKDQRELALEWAAFCDRLEQAYGELYPGIPYQQWTPEMWHEVYMWTEGEGGDEEGKGDSMNPERKAINTNEELVRVLVDLFNEVGPETPEEIDAVLREAGHDPRQVGARMKAVAERAIAAYLERNSTNEERA